MKSAEIHTNKGVMKLNFFQIEGIISFVLLSRVIGTFLLRKKQVHGTSEIAGQSAQFFQPSLS